MYFFFRSHKGRRWKFPFVFIFRCRVVNDLGSSSEYAELLFAHISSMTSSRLFYSRLKLSRKKASANHLVWNAKFHQSTMQPKLIKQSNRFLVTSPPTHTRAKFHWCLLTHKTIETELYKQQLFFCAEISHCCVSFALKRCRTLFFMLSVRLIKQIYTRNRKLYLNLIRWFIYWNLLLGQ